MQLSIFGTSTTATTTCTTFLVTVDPSAAWQNNSCEEDKNCHRDNRNISRE